LSIASRVIIGLFFSAAATTAIHAQSQSIRAESYLRSFHDLNRFNGAAIIVDEGRILFEGGFGFADIENQLAVDATSRFPIASLTRQFTAALILKLNEEGLLDLYAPIHSIINEYPLPNGERITTHHLLTHTSGLPMVPNIPDSTGTLSPADILALTWNEALQFKPGTQSTYSNSESVLLEWIVERVTGMSYGDALSLFVLDPVGLGDTGYEHGLTSTNTRVKGYTRQLTEYKSVQDSYSILPYVDGILFSTVRDLGRWASVISEWGEAPSPFLERKTLEQMLTLSPGPYGYGFHIRHQSIGREENVELIEHTGGIPGFSSFLRVFPKHRRLIVLLDNTASALSPIMEGLTSLLWGAEAEPPKPSIAQRILPIVESAGVAPAIERYRNWRQTRPTEYDYSPKELMLLAEHFQNEDPTVAIKILEAQAEETPEIPLTRFALAELYAKQGDTVRAISHVEAALTFSPGTPNLLTKIQELGGEPDPALTFPTIPVEMTGLKRLAGEYRIDPVTLLTVELDDGSLLAHRSNESGFQLLPQSATTFLLRGSKVQFIFDLVDGQAASVSILEGGRRVSFSRLPSH
jgi:CubicO group peptidase (beta-lactamase class C family)